MDGGRILSRLAAPLESPNDDASRAWRIAAAGLAALAVAMGIGRFAFTPLLPLMQRDNGLSLAAGGWVAAANYLGYFLGALLAVRIKHSPLKMIWIGLLMTAVFTGAMGLTHVLALWLLLRFAGGIASAWVMVFTASWSLRLLVSLGQPRMTGLVFSGVGVGIAVAGVFCLILAHHHIMAPAVWCLLGFLALLTAVCVIALTRSASVSQPDRSSPVAVFSGRWSKETLVLIACYGIFGFGYIVPATFLPVIARQTLHNAVWVGLFWPIFGVAAFASTLAFAFWAQRHDDRRILCVSFFLEAIGVALLALSHTISGEALSALLVGGTFMVITMYGLREARRLAPANSSRLIASMTAAFAIGQIIGPILASVLVRMTGHFTTILLLATGLMIFGGGMLSRRVSVSHAEGIEFQS
jgi:MFS family permease